MKTLSLMALLVVTGALGASATEPPSHQIDHVGLGLADLEEATRLVTERTGVEPVFGGEHPNLGTHNALLSLGDGRYLEVIAPRPDAGVGFGMAAGLARLGSLTGVLWAVTSRDVGESRRLLAAAGFDTTAPRPGSRVTPGGTTLAWETFGLAGSNLPGAPFFIRWGEGVTHPSNDSPPGCELIALTVTTPAAAELGRLVETLQLGDVRVVTGEALSIGVELECPTGRVAF